MVDKPDKQPVNTDNEYVRQHHRLAEGQQPATGGSNDKGKPTKW